MQIYCAVVDVIEVQGIVYGAQRKHEASECEDGEIRQSLAARPV
jgi:hypothetical protein